MSGAKFNSLSNGSSFNRVHRVKNEFKGQIPGFWSDLPGKPGSDSLNDLC